MAVAAAATTITTAAAAVAAEGGGWIINGLCGVGNDSQVWSRTRWCGNVGGDLLFLRRAPKEVAFGVASSVGTSAFRDVSLLVGPKALLPLASAWVTEITSGPLVYRGDGTTGAGFGAWLFVGERRFNYHGPYSMAWGLTAGYEQSFGEGERSALIIGARLDGVLLGVPIVMGIGGLRGRGR